MRHAALAAGDRHAMAQVIRRHGPGLRRFLAGMLAAPHEAEDIAQETFFSASGRRPRAMTLTKPRPLL